MSAMMHDCRVIRVVIFKSSSTQYERANYFAAFVGFANDFLNYILYHKTIFSFVSKPSDRLLALNKFFLINQPILSTIWSNTPNWVANLWSIYKLF